MKAFGFFMLMSMVLSTALAQGTTNYSVLRGSSLLKLDDARSRLTIGFTLPDNIRRTDWAIIQMGVRGSEYDRNEVYINPAAEMCDSDDQDTNTAASIGYLDEHDDVNLKNEWTTNIVTFNQRHLQPGRNVLLICVRYNAGRLGSGAGSVDAVDVRSIVLLYRVQ